MEEKMSEWIAKTQSLSEAQEAFVLVTLTAIRGSAPQVVGAKMLVTAEGLYHGTVGGGKIEAHCIEYAKDLLRGQKASEQRAWNLQKDIGMSCGGEVTLFFDCHFPTKWNIAVFGAGHISQQLCRILQPWYCRLQVFDTRPEWIGRLPESPNLKKKISQELAAEVDRLSEDTYLLCMTQGHATDFPILRRALLSGKNFPLIGVIGSEVKAMKLKKELMDAGVAGEKVKAVISPLGLPLGNNTPAEIAVSIASQLLAVRDGVSFQIENGRVFK